MEDLVSIDRPPKIGQADRRPAAPLNAGRQIESAVCALPFLSAAVGHLRYRNSSKGVAAPGSDCASNIATKTGSWGHSPLPKCPPAAAVFRKPLWPSAIMRLRHFIFAIAAASLVTSGCRDAHQGQSNANESPVPDGRIVLLKRRNEVAAFILSKQRVSPEQTDFHWYYRSDGKGTFPIGDPAVTSGFVSNASKVAFSTFTVQWSMSTDRLGWVYFSSSPVELGKVADFVMCVTTETNLAAIDANDRSWKYRARPSVNVRALIESQIKQ